MSNSLTATENGAQLDANAQFDMYSTSFQPSGASGISNTQPGSFIVPQMPQQQAIVMNENNQLSSISNAHRLSLGDGLNNGKRHSPKHRILQQQQMVQPAVNSHSASGQSALSTSSSSPRMSPYKIPPSSSMVPYNVSVQSQPSRGNGNAHCKVEEANSELMQLLQNSTSNVKAKVPPLPANAMPQPPAASHRNAVKSKSRSSHSEVPAKRKQVKKYGFEELKSLLPAMSGGNVNNNGGMNASAAGVKISKAALLHKGGDYLKELISEKDKVNHEIDALKTQATVLKESLQVALAGMAEATGGAGIS